VLWRQAGGSRWRLLLERGTMHRSAEALLCRETG
jgi:CII-binding regulator of phage lambda lysogenization HflD